MQQGGKQNRNRGGATERKRRIAKLIAAGWIREEAEIPSDDIPVDIDRPPTGGLSPPHYYQDYKFVCRDCGTEQVWTA